MNDTKAEQLEHLYRTERGRLERIAGRKVGSSGAADVVQDVFASLWARAREQVNLTPAYVARATQYVAISHFRAEHRRAAFLRGIAEEQYAPPFPLPDQIVAARDELRRLEEAVAALPPRTRQVFLLNRMHHCTYDEIALALGVSYSTVEREMARALMACKSVR